MYYIKNNSFHPQNARKKGRNKPQEVIVFLYLCNPEKIVYFIINIIKLSN
jgi:hypothetical protein